MFLPQLKIKFAENLWKHKGLIQFSLKTMLTVVEKCKLFLNA